MQSEKKSWIKGKRSLAGHPPQRSTKDLQSLIFLTSLANIKPGNIAKQSSNSRHALNLKNVILSVLKNKTCYKTGCVSTRDFTVCIFLFGLNLLYEQ